MRYMILISQKTLHKRVRLLTLHAKKKSKIHTKIKTLYTSRDFANYYFNFINIMNEKNSIKSKSTTRSYNIVFHC